MWMLNMEILPVLLLCLSVAVSAQYRSRSPGFRNPGFRNVRTPLATAPSRDRPFISIPIVLLPDGQQVPKPKQTTYHYVGHATRNSPSQSNQRNQKQKSSFVGKAAVNYQVSVPPPASTTQQQRAMKPPKLSVAQLNSHLRNPHSNAPRNRGQPQNLQQSKSVQSQIEQNYQFPNQFVKHQRGPSFQTQGPPSQQTLANHKQNLANFVNFATSLGASVVGQHQNQAVILPTQTTSAGSTLQSQNQNMKQQQTHQAQRPLIENHKMTAGVTFQHQVPSLASAQSHNQPMAHQSAANQNNGYSLPQQQTQSQLSLSSQQQHSPNFHSQQQIASLHSQHQTAGLQPQQQHSTQHQPHSSQLQQQAQNHQTQNQQTHHQLTSQNSHSPDPQSQQQSHNPQSQQQSHNPQSQQPNQATAHAQQQNFPSSGGYSPDSNVRQNSQQTQTSGSSSSVSNPAHQAQVAQQSKADNLRSQINSQQHIMLLNGYNSPQMQNNQQSYVLAQQNSVPSNYNNQSPQSKSISQTSQQSSNLSNNQNPNTAQVSYVGQSQEHYPQSQVTFTGTLPQSSGYPIDQIAELNSFALQNAHDGQVANPLSYFQYQTAQELPFNLETFLSQGQTSYISSPSNTQDDSTIGQTYSVLPNSQNLYVNAGETVFSDSQEESPSTSLADIGLQSYDTYADSHTQAGYASAATSQINQNSFLNTPNSEKGYQNTQYTYLQNPQEGSSTSTSGEGQDSQSSSSSLGPGPLIYASSSAKQINYSPASTGEQQQYSPSNYQSSPTYVSFTTASGSNFKTDTPTSLSYAQRPTGVVTPGTTYAKLNTVSEKQQSEAATETSEDSEYDEEDGDEEEASYKVVYIPLDILKNILSNSVESQ